MISLTTKYAVRALEFLAQQSSDAYVSIEAISEGSDVAAPYLAKILKTLAAKKLIESKKGLNGGFRLSREGPPVTLFQVAESLDDPLTRVSCFMDKAECGVKRFCTYHAEWSSLKANIQKFLNHSIIWDPGRKAASRKVSKRRAR